MNSGRRRMLRRAVLAAVVAGAIAAVAPDVGSAHITYSCSTQYNPYGVCSTFRGYTENSSGGVVDPINFVFYPYGGRYAADSDMAQMGWGYTCGSTQSNYRIRYPTYWSIETMDGQRGSSWCPNSRYHMRFFDGHHAYGSYYQWSVADAHHESAPYHNIDMSWNSARDYVAALAASYGWYYDCCQTQRFVFLPRGQGWFQGYYADGWATRING